MTNPNLAVTLLSAQAPQPEDLPARGMLELTADDSGALRGTWRRELPNGLLADPVTVADPVFVHVPPAAALHLEAAAGAAVNGLLDSFADVEDVTARALDIVRAVLGAVDGRALTDAL
ncbi:hypothetical protein CHO01_29060 [Cellulomonas hominis]|uniref:Uncharacterized protein n=1 Tax=Cellulomonas hominis TaxID=156981 RepID=A0A511FEW0_9CELL|nr:hypothetical protein [Cellulomonas hominis]MBB5474745.1 hypothetical protein [Cellulomonas hominis]NKY05401.1 hypothetical protein [Cellulomonas hominis]GEL47790.1 hypothetical protein CHO01_29060 [Cellulomonas hominis]